MRSKRVLALLLSALLLLPTLASCATGEPSTNDGSSTTASTNETNTDELKDSLPDDLDYNEDEIVFVSTHASGIADEIFAPAIAAEPVNDAVFERNKTVENRLNVKITSVHAGEPTDQAIHSVTSGSGDYDVMVARSWVAAPKTIEGYFANLRDTLYLDFDQPWWTQSFNDVMHYRDLQFAVTGAMVLSTYRRTYTTAFNKSVFTDANQPFLYEYVEDGTWTLDKQISLVPLFHRDNGNGIQDDQGDVYGFASGGMASIDAYWSSCQLDIIRKDADGVYEVVLDMDRLHSAAEKILALFHGTDGASRIFAPHGMGAEHDDIRELFAAGYSAMATLRIIELERSSMRNMSQKFGVVPMPKYDESQADYYTLLQDQLTVFTIPTTVTGDRLDEVSAVLEAMASTSYRIVRPAYYETTLRTKIAQDPQSSEMMARVIDGIYIDAGILYVASLPGFQGELRALVNSNNNDAISRFKSVSTRTRSSVRAIMKRLDRIKQKQER